MFSQSTQDKLDPYQFAYKQECSTEDAVANLMHLVSKIEPDLYLDGVNKVVQWCDTLILNTLKTEEIIF